MILTKLFLFIKDDVIRNRIKSTVEVTMVPVDIFLHEVLHVSAWFTATGLLVGSNLAVWLLLWVLEGAVEEELS